MTRPPVQMRDTRYEIRPNGRFLRRGVKGGWVARRAAKPYSRSAFVWVDLVSRISHLDGWAVGVDFFRTGIYLALSTDRPVSRLQGRDLMATVTATGDKRTRLVKAACAVFAEKGYGSTRVAEIAERAGVLPRPVVE